MSSWELKTHQFLDNNPNIIEWSSEEVIIPYVSPIDKKIHRYYVDYYVKYKNKKGEIIEEIWEVKPSSQVQQPSGRGKSKKQQLHEAITFSINKAKWKSAQAYASKKGWKFRILTEKELFK